MTRSRVIGLVVISTSMMLGCRPPVGGPTLVGRGGPELPNSPLVQQSAANASAPAADNPVGLSQIVDYQSMPALRDIYFDFGKATIRPDDMKILDANAAWLRDNPVYLVLIEGHSDNRGATNGKNERNMDLADRRAQAAMTYLVARGIHPSRFTILSYGEERPQCAEATERCWRQNRRVRFLVKPR